VHPGPAKPDSAYKGNIIENPLSLALLGGNSYLKKKHPMMFCFPATGLFRAVAGVEESCTQEVVKSLYEIEE
jgi:hypothetical protein